MKDSGIEWIGEIPSHWEVTRLKRMTKVKRGSSPRPIDNPKYFDENGQFSWVRISDVTKSERYLISTEEKLSELGCSLSTKVYPNQLFLSIAGSVGKPIISKIECCIHDGFVWFDNLNFNPELLWYQFNVGTCFSGLGKMGTQLNLNSDTVGMIHFPIPPLSEQEQIVSYLDDITSQIDKTIDIENEKIELLKEYRQSLISNVVTGKIKVIE
jgi:type I restriction enzyme S subunit